jgi:hypothetical protein
MDAREQKKILACTTIDNPTINKVSFSLLFKRISCEGDRIPPNTLNELL